MRKVWMEARRMGGEKEKNENQQNQRKNLRQIH